MTACIDLKVSTSYFRWHCPHSIFKCHAISVLIMQSGGEASIVAEVVEVEENSTNMMQTLRIPPVLTVNKSAAYAMYQLTYIRVGDYLFIYFVCVSVGACIYCSREHSHSYDKK